MSSAPTLKELASTLARTTAASLNGLAGSRIASCKQQAASYFLENGFPTIRHEEWKYTNVMPLAKAPLAVTPEVAALPDDVIEHIKTIGTDAILLVFVNGVFYSEISDTLPLDKGTLVLPIEQALHENLDSIADSFGTVLPPNFDSFAALNTAAATQGMSIAIDSDVHATPIAIVHVSDARQTSPFAQLRHWIHLGQGASASLRTAYLSLGENTSLLNTAIEITLESNAKLSMMALQGEKENAHQVNTTFAKQDGNSTFSLTTLSYGEGFVRNTTHSALESPGAHTDMFGLVATGKKAFTDNHTLIDHAAPHCTSNETFKHVLGGRSTAVFNGKIMVRPDAQKTNAYQSNRTLLLSDAASINTKPQLEIFADDVKCSHGATSGQLDQESLFYLRARGIPEAEARLLLTIAFADEILDTVNEEFLRQPVSDAVHAFLSDTVH